MMSWFGQKQKYYNNTTVLREAKAELESDRTIWQFQWDLKCNLPRLSIGNWLELDFGFGTSHMFHHPMSEQKQIFSELPDTEALFHYYTNKQSRPSYKTEILVRVISDCINQGCVWGGAIPVTRVLGMCGGQNLLPTPPPPYV